MKDRKLVVPRKSLRKFIQKGHLESINRQDYYDFDEAKKYIKQNELVIHYQEYLDEVSKIDDELYENFDFLEVNGKHLIRLNYTNKWFLNLEARSFAYKNMLHKKWGNYYISHKGIDLLQEAEKTGLLVPF